MEKFRFILGEASLLEVITNDTDVQYINLPNGCILRKTWRSIAFCDENWNLHRINGPARAWKMSDGGLGKFEFWVNGKQLSKSEFEKHFEIENYDMDPSSINEASLLEYDPSGPNVVYTSVGNGYEIRETPTTIAFLKNGIIHRTNGPALARKLSNGKFGEFEFWVNGKYLLKREFEQHFEIENYDMGPSSLNEESMRRKINKKITMLPDGSKKVEDDLSISYWKDGKLHRTDGPAFFRKDPKTGKLIYCQYYVDGYLISYTDWHMHFTDEVANKVPVMADDIS